MFTIRRHKLKRLLLTLLIPTALVTGAFAQGSYDNATIIVVYTTNQTLAQNLASLNAYIDENIEPTLEYTVTAESTMFDYLFGFRMIRFRAYDVNGDETLMMPGDYRVLDGLEPFWAQEIPTNITAVYRNEFGGPGNADDLILNTGVMYSNQSATAIIALATPAPAGGLRVTVRSNNTALRVPATVIVPAGQRTVSFRITTGNVTRTAGARVTAVVRGRSLVETIMLRTR